MYKVLCSSPSTQKTIYWVTVMAQVVYMGQRECKNVDTAKWQPRHWDSRHRRVVLSSQFCEFSIIWKQLGQSSQQRDNQTQWGPQLLCPWGTHMHILMDACIQVPYMLPHTCEHTMNGASQLPRVIQSWYYCLVGETQAPSMNPHSNGKEIGDSMV